MQPQTHSELQYFIGKICSIITNPINRSFSEQIAREHFVVRIKKITSDGIVGEHPHTPGLKSFFFFSNIVSIHEEIELDPNNPEHAEFLSKYEQKESDLKFNADPLNVISNKKSSVSNLETEDLIDKFDATFVDINELEKLAEKSKKTFDIQNQFS